MTLYTSLKLLHLFSLIAWMAGLFYLPRLFVYHAQEKTNTCATDVFVVMERRLYQIIMMPAMFFTLASGTMLAMIPGIVDWSMGWIHVKLSTVLGLVIFHHLLNRWRKALQEGLDTHSVRFFRIVNEIPTLFLLLILICVVIKPF